jgi:hypothetical protein
VVFSSFPFWKVMQHGLLLPHEEHINTPSKSSKSKNYRIEKPVFDSTRLLVLKHVCCCGWVTFLYSKLFNGRLWVVGNFACAMVLKMSILKMSSNTEIRQKGECCAAVRVRALDQGLWLMNYERSINQLWCRGSWCLL